MPVSREVHINERVVIRRPGGLEALQVVREAAPTPQPGQARVRILASGVAFGDVLLRRGIGYGASTFPATPGYDFVGVVDALGGGSARFSLGDQVAGFPVTGGQQTFICLPERDLIPLPSGVAPNEAVSVILNYTTAYQLLNRVARLQAGDSVLMHGAAGGVGTALLQLARLQGVKVYGTVSAGKMDTVRALGGVPIDYQRADFVPQLLALEPTGVRAVFDPVGGAQLTRSYRALARGGTLVVLGVSAATRSRHPTLTLAGTLGRLLALKLRPGARRVVLYTITSARTRQPEQLHQDIQTLLTLLQQGQIKPQIARVLPLGAVREAHALLEGAQVTGKIILQP